jgi:NAD(P)-dependent dehydrogenase (short-subunit alcohol dehydrogenase family)
MTFAQAQGMFRTHKTFETACTYLVVASQRKADTLVNNASVFIAKPFTEYSEKDFATMIAVNLAGFFHLSQKAAAWMLRMGSGHIVNITTAIAEQPVASLPAALAALTKGGLNAITRSLAIEYASRHVRVNAVSRSRRRCIRRRRTTFSAGCSRWAEWVRCRRSPTP